MFLYIDFIEKPSCIHILRKYLMKSLYRQIYLLN